MKQGIVILVASVTGENTPSLKLFRRLDYKECAHYRRVAVKFGRKQDIIDFQKFLTEE